MFITNPWVPGYSCIAGIEQTQYDILFKEVSAWYLVHFLLLNYWLFIFKIKRNHFPLNCKRQVINNIQQNRSFIKFGITGWVKTTFFYKINNFVQLSYIFADYWYQNRIYKILKITCNIIKSRKHSRNLFLFRNYLENLHSVDSITVLKNHGHGL